jgi:septation ring formation regulator EzrA
MKKLLFLLTVLTSLFTLPLVGMAKDKDKDKDREYEKEKKLWKETRDDVRELREQYGRLVETLRREGASKRVWEDVDFIGADVQRVSTQFERGNYDYRDLHTRISQLEDAIKRTRKQIDYEHDHRRSFKIYIR